MFNIVRRRDFMLGHDLPTREEAQKLCDEKYGGDHVVIETAPSVPARNPPAAPVPSRA
jgi:hypothetical protein